MSKALEVEVAHDSEGVKVETRLCPDVSATTIRDGVSGTTIRDGLMSSHSLAIMEVDMPGWTRRPQSGCHCNLISIVVIIIIYYS